jgi:polyphosphate glucokinase
MTMAKKTVSASAVEKTAAASKPARNAAAARQSAAARGNVFLGVDVGGSGIKGAPVDVSTGQLVQPRVRLATPAGAQPVDVEKVIVEVVGSFDTSGPIGLTFPGVIIRGQVNTAANMGKDWIGVDIAAEVGQCVGRPVRALNDADAAGIAEMRFGAGRGKDGRGAEGVVIMITLGTGIGCAVFHDGILLPNTELGHLELDGKDAEETAAARVRDDKDLSWKDYAKRVEKYVRHIDKLLWPDLVIIGGGVSKKAAQFLPLVQTRCKVVPAELFNDAGIVGAALAVAGR